MAQTKELETVMERTIRKMDEECCELMEFWRRNETEYIVRERLSQEFASNWYGYIRALSDMKLLEAPEIREISRQLACFTVRLNESLPLYGGA